MYYFERASLRPCKPELVGPSSAIYSHAKTPLRFCARLGHLGLRFSHRAAGYFCLVLVGEMESTWSCHLCSAAMHEAKALSFSSQEKKREERVYFVIE